MRVTEPTPVCRSKAGSKIMKRTFPYIACFILASLAVLHAAERLTPAVTNQRTVLYVSPSGGTSFTLAQPGSLEGARDYVRAMGANLTNDIVIRLLGGTYQFTNSFQLR